MFSGSRSYSFDGFPLDSRQEKRGEMKSNNIERDDDLQEIILFYTIGLNISPTED
jgi:hypothetical protein